MFFDNIGADLHFVHEAETGHPEARRIFSSYQNAAQCYGKDNTTWLAAFLLNEHGRVVNKYKSPWTAAAQDASAVLHEHVTLETLHACNHTRFMARVWRASTCLKDTGAADEADQVIVKAIERGVPGQNSAVLYEARPVAFPSDQTSMWVDVGVLHPLPDSDISITIERPSRKQTITSTFRYQPPVGSLPVFPGVPVNQAQSLIPRSVVTGSEDERHLLQLVRSYVAKNKPTSPGPACAQAQAPVPSAVGPSAADPSSTQASSPTLSAGSLPSPTNAFATLLASVPPLTHASAHALQLPSSTQAVAATTITPSSTQRSPSFHRSSPLISRAWSAFAGAASAFAPALTCPGAISPSAVAADSAQAADHAQSGNGTPAADAPVDVQQPNVQVEQATDENGAADMPESEQGAYLADQLNKLVNSICDTLDVTLDQARADLDAETWKDLELVDRSTQTGNGSKNVGVSYTDGQNVQGQASAQVTEPLVLPGGTNAPSVPLPNDTGTSNGSGPPTNADAVASAPCDSAANDVEMEDGTSHTAEGKQAAFGPGTSAQGSVPATDTMDECDHVGQNPTALIPTSSVPAASDLQIVAAEPVASNEAPSGSTSQAAHKNVDASQPAFASSESDVPLAHLRATPVPQTEGSMMVARRPRSRYATASQASQSALIRRAGSRSAASPAPSSGSRSSTFMADEERREELFTYLMTLVSNDKLKDDARCLQLSEKRAQETDSYEQIRQTFETKIAAMNSQIRVAREQVLMKRDTMRFLRSQYEYRPGVTDARFRSKVGDTVRMGSERARSRSRSIAGSVAGSRRTPVPSVVPPSLFKRERIDLTRDDDDRVAGSIAGSTRRGQSCVPPAARNSGNMDASHAIAPIVKVGDISDLMQNPPVTAKRSASVHGGVAGRVARSRAGSVRSAQPHTLSGSGGMVEGVGERQVQEWMTSMDRSRASRRAATPAPGSSNINTGMMPPPLPRTPLAAIGSQASSPIVIGDDGEMAIDTVRRRRSISRTPSVRSRISQTSHTRPTQSRAGSVAAAPIAIDDDGERAAEAEDGGSDDENEEPLFLGRRSQRANSVATSRFSELVGP